MLAGLLASLGVSVLAASFDDRLGDESPATETAGTHKTAVQAKTSSTFRINLNPYTETQRAHKPDGRIINRETLAMKPTIETLPEQPGDMTRTLADLTLSGRDLGYAPKVSMEEGIRRFADWWRAQE